MSNVPPNPHSSRFAGGKRRIPKRGDLHFGTQIGPSPRPSAFPQQGAETRSDPDSDRNQNLIPHSSVAATIYDIIRRVANLVFAG